MLAKSIDRAEHSGTLKGVMAVEQVDSQGQEADAALRQHQMYALICGQVRRQQATLIVKKIATCGGADSVTHCPPRALLGDTRAVV